MSQHRRATHIEPDIGITEGDDDCAECAVLATQEPTHTMWGVLFAAAAVSFLAGFVAAIVLLILTGQLQ